MIETVTGEDSANILLGYLELRGITGTARRGRPAPGGAVANNVLVDGETGGLRGLPFLRRLAGCFAEFPYENISKIIKVFAVPSLEQALRLPTEVVTDHLERNFGGTCFSLTFLFERLLKALGFDCYKVMADMNSGRNVHCLVVVCEGGGKYIVDPGYALYEVIALPGGRGRADGALERVRFPHAVVELEREAARVGVSGQSGAAGTAGLSDAVGRSAPAAPDTYSLWTEDATGRKWRYRFVDEPTPDTVFERHWLESFGKPTLNNICLTRMTPRGHIYLRKDFFKFTSPTAVEKRRIAQGREKLIEQEFGIGAEWVKAAQDLLDRNRARTGESAGAGAEASGRTGAEASGRTGAQTGAWAPGRKEVAGG